MGWARSHWSWVVGILLVVAASTALLQAATLGSGAGPSPVVARQAPAVSVTPASGPSSPMPPSPTPPVPPVPGFTPQDWARPFDIEGVRLGMSRKQAWESMGERSRWRRSRDGPLEIWTSLDVPARRVVFTSDGRVEALSGLSLGHQGRLVFTGSVDEALARLGPPDLKGNALLDETWIWNRHRSVGFIGLHVKSGRVVISRSEDRVL